MFGIVRKFVLLFICLAAGAGFTPGMAAAQDTGIITGTVVDGSTGETLVGATVRVEGTTPPKGAICDLEGNYRITGVPVGTYELTASMIGYANTRVTDVEVKKGEVAKVDFVLNTEEIQVDEVVVKAQAVRNTEAVLLKDRQKAEAVSDAVSSEAISRAGASDAADAMRQVTGASVVDGKEVYVRGLGDRYTSVLLNGSELPSANPYKRSAPLDLFPSNLLDNIVTAKSFTPDKPGNFSGGTVNVQTKNFPESLFLSVSASGSYNSQSTFTDDFLTANTSGTDWLGYDDGARDLPDILEDRDTEIPSIGETFTDLDKALTLDRITKSFPSVMAPLGRSGLMNQSYSFSVGNQVEAGGRPLGFVGSLSYSRNFSAYEDGVSAMWELTGREADTKTLSNVNNLKDTRGTEEVLIGALANVAYRIHPNHSLSVNYVHNQNGEHTARFLEGQYPYDLDDDDIFQTSAIQYTERSLDSSQLRGEHVFSALSGSRLEWKTSYSLAQQDQPDLRYFTGAIKNQVRRREDGTEYLHSIPIIKSNTPPARYFRNMDETQSEHAADLNVPLKSVLDRNMDIKLGGLYSRRDREFRERAFNYRQNPSYDYNGDPNDLFAPANLGLVDSTKTKTIHRFNLFVEEYFQNSANYDAEQTVSAVYGMIDIPVVDRLRFIGGARYESTDMEVASQDTTIDVGKISTDDLLPSINLVYSLLDNMNLRMAYGRTLARPSFREMADYPTFDFVGGFTLIGNPHLESTLIDNYDLRWEWFVRPGEIYAVSAFAKTFDKPIERVIININGEVRFQNVDEARVMGLEFELRKQLDTVSEKLKNFAVGSNFSIVSSRVDIAPAELSIIRKFNPDAKDYREFQGQSPYILNLDLAWDKPEQGLNASLYYNVFGERLSEVSLASRKRLRRSPKS